MKTLLLGSSSQSRQTLLREIGIPFMIVGHYADEDAVPHGTTLQETVRAIAQHKMAHITMPEGSEGHVVFVLTADTMGTDHTGKVHGKPKDRVDAVSKIRACRDGVLITATGFCIEKRLFTDGHWVTQRSHVQVVSAESVFYVPDSWMDRYLEHSLAMTASGAVAIELYGGQFLQSVNGSYSCIVGLPLVEVRCALETLGFFD